MVESGLEPKNVHARQLLQDYGISPKKSLGQNFLSDYNILEAIVEHAQVGEHDQVLEIGPGLGSLTRHLARKARQVIAVELDDRLIPILHNETLDYNNISIIHADILEISPATIVQPGYKVVGNIPYYITGSIMRHLLSSMPRPARLTLTLQEEVAKRMAAKPGDMSLLSVVVQYYGNVVINTKIKAGAFWPRPDVDSAVVSLTIRKQLPLIQADEKEFFRLVKVGFNQKRKQLQKNLRAIIKSRKRIDQVLQTADIDGQRRAQSLSVDDWLVLYRATIEH